MFDIDRQEMHVLAGERAWSYPSDPFSRATRKELLDASFVERVAADPGSDQRCRLPDVGEVVAVIRPCIRLSSELARDAFEYDDLWFGLGDHH
jgi:hypothetical protein